MRLLDVIRSPYQAAGLWREDYDCGPGFTGFSCLCPSCLESSTVLVAGERPEDVKRHCPNNCDAEAVSSCLRTLAEPAPEVDARAYCMNDQLAGREATLSGEHDADLATLGEVPKYPVDALPAPAQRLIEAHTLPAALVGGPVLAALATAVGGSSALEVTNTWRERAILWVVNIAPAGAGKSPAQTLAFAPLRDAEADVLVDDVTLEALARKLAQGDGAAGFDVDEASQLIRGLGEYKGGGGDRGRLLARWEGGPWNAGRVGDGKNGKLGVDLRIARPTVVICAGLQPHLHALLGGERDGLRPRWLPHLAELPAEIGDVGRVDIDAVDGWCELVGAILGRRGHERTWQLSAAGSRAFNACRRDWKAQAREALPPGIAGALLKADKQLARVAPVLAEADNPGAGGTVGGDAIERAALIVEFTLDSWRALPEQSSSLGLTRRDQVLGDAVDQLAAWLEARPAREATRREIQRARVAGVRKPSEVDALLEDYAQHYPGTVKTETLEGGGKPMTVVSARRRVRARNGVTTGDTGCAPPSTPRSRAKSEPNGRGDTALVTPLGDTALATPREPEDNGHTLDLLGALEPYSAPIAEPYSARTGRFDPAAFKTTPPPGRLGDEDRERRDIHG